MNILFVCTGNTCRSVLAHYYAAKLAADEKLPLKFASAGLAAHKDIPQPAIVAALLAKEGVQELNHLPVEMTEILAENSDLLLTMTSAQKDRLTALYPSAAQKTALLTQYAGFGGGDIADPYGRDDLFYAEIFQTIKTAVKASIEKLKKEVK